MRGQARPPPPGQGPGPDGIKSIIEEIVAVWADFHIVVHDVVDGRGTGGNGLVAVRGSIRGTHVGEFFGVPATELDYSISIHEFCEIRDGQIARTWHLEDLVQWSGQARDVSAAGKELQA